MRWLKCFCFLLFLQCLPGCAYYFGNQWTRRFADDSESRSIEFRRSTEASRAQTADNTALLNYWADKKLAPRKEGMKVTGTRVILGKLETGKDVEAVNDFLLASEPWGKPGTSYKLNPRGDYDFTEIVLCAILHLYGDQPDKLYPQTAKHIAHTLIMEKPGRIKTRTPRLLGIMKETENHILMRNISNYLRNQWLWAHQNKSGAFNNRQNGLEAFLLEHLEEMRRTGFYEFNSRPYLGYTFGPLLILEAFTDSEEIRNKVREILDEANWVYAMGSMDFGRNAPFRRRMSHFTDTRLDDDPHGAFMRVWALQAKGRPVTPEAVPHGRHHALLAALLPYRPPAEILRLCEAKPEPYFLKVGHGPGACPELFSGGPGYLLSGGGVQRGRASQIVPRPIVLQLADGEVSWKNCFHILPGEEMRELQQTGVWQNFAVGRGPVSVPEGMPLAAESGGWQLYRPALPGAPLVCVFNAPDFGLLALFHLPETKPQELLMKIRNGNPENGLRNRFEFPGGPEIAYDLNARKNQWVIAGIDGEAVNRNFDTWPRISGVIPDPYTGK